MLIFAPFKLKIKNYEEVFISIDDDGISSSLRPIVDTVESAQKDRPGQSAITDGRAE